ncbi:MAG: hypothetical protein U0840_13890 [Gemmataceae bacterium]
MKKFIAMLLVGAVLFTGAVGCGGDTPAKDKDKAAKDKDKAATPEKDKKDK